MAADADVTVARETQNGCSILRRSRRLRRQDAARARLSYCYAILWFGQRRSFSRPEMAAMAGWARGTIDRSPGTRSHQTEITCLLHVSTPMISSKLCCRHWYTTLCGYTMHSRKRYSTLTQRQDRGCFGGANLLPLCRHKRVIPFVHRPITNIRAMGTTGAPCLYHTIGLLRGFRSLTEPT